MLDIQTFDARAGGNLIYKALAHPLAAEAIERLAKRLRARPLAVYDPDGVAGALWSMHPSMPAPQDVYVHDVSAIGQVRAGIAARPLTDLAQMAPGTLLIAAFDAGRLEARIGAMAPDGVETVTLDAAKIPPEMLTQPSRYLERTNFATNYAFFRDTGAAGGDGLHTRLVTANYWAGYGAKSVRLWCRLFDADGRVLAQWDEPTPEGPGGIAIDSQEVRARFGLPDFTGQLFVHAIGAAGHDVVKYALDTYGTGAEPSLSCTHDANAWPSDRYAGMPAPGPGERVIFWLQNSHAAPIPPGAIALDRMGAEQPVALDRALPGYATAAIDVASVLPGVAWPAQVEVRAGRHIVRPRYEVVRDGRSRIAHLNVERADLPPDRFRSIVLPTPMAESQGTLPLRLEVFDRGGRKTGERFLGALPRDHSVAIDLDEFGAGEGHAELVYDFQAGGEADGWMHCLVRYEHRATGHAAESSFGAHIYNTAMTYRDEPQSYSGPPPGLSTRLYLKLGDRTRHSFAALIYAASAPWHAQSETTLLLHDAGGAVIAERPLAIACSGSAMVFPHEAFGPALLDQAGPGGYVIIRDATCRLFGYHGLMTEAGAFSLDHMFGF